MKPSLILNDGSLGEGGGRILRTALGLSMVTGQPFRMEKIRARTHFDLSQPPCRLSPQVITYRLRFRGISIVPR